MNAALWFWEQSNETMTVLVDCLAGERKPYMTGNDATKYGFDACMYALGVLPPNYPVPAIQLAVNIWQEPSGGFVEIVELGSDGMWDTVWESDACHIHPVPAIEHAVFAHSDMRGHRVLIVSHDRCGDDDDLIFIRELPLHYPVPAPRELTMIAEMWLQCCSDFDADAIYY